MTKSKLLKLFKELNSNIVILTYYDYMRMDLERAKDIVNKVNRPFLDDCSFFVCGEYTIADIINDYQTDKNPNDYIFDGLTFRDVYDNIKEIKKKPLYVKKYIEESANEYYRYLLIHQKELDKYHNEMRSVLKMYLNSYIGGGYR